MISRSLWRGQIQSTKTQASKRVIGMPEQLAQILLSHRRATNFTAPEDFVFCQADGRPMAADSLRRCGIYAAMKTLGIPVTKRASGCHAFRHLAGSLIHKGTGSLKLAQKQLGHSNVSTTADIYTHVGDQEMDQPAEILGKAFSHSVAESIINSKNVQQCIVPTRDSAKSAVSADY